jgi:hypothetical protein
MLLCTQAAYNNTAELEPEDDDVHSTVSSLSPFSIGTKVAKQFEGDNQQLVWFEGTIQRFVVTLVYVMLKAVPPIFFDNTHQYARVVT